MVKSRVAAGGSGSLIALLSGKAPETITGDVPFDDPQGAEKPFAPHYQQYLLPHVRTFENDRLEKLKKFRKRTLIAIPSCIAIIVIIVAVWVFRPFSQDAQEFITGLGFAMMVGAAAIAYAPVMAYKASVKDKIFPNIFSFFGPDYSYSPDGGLSIDSLKASSIIPGHNRKHTEDYVKGSYKDVSLELMEATLRHESGSGRNRRVVTKFKGVFVLLSMNKNFSGKTIVKRDAGKIGNWFSKKLSNLENVKLEDPVFEKQFECYGTDQVEARYLLTTSFMQRLLDLSGLFDNSGIQASFYENKLLLMIPSKENRFEVGSIYQPATFKDDIDTILKEMNVIFQIIDILKLDQKTGL